MPSPCIQVVIACTPAASWKLTCFLTDLLVMSKLIHTYNPGTVKKYSLTYFKD